MQKREISQIKAPAPRAQINGKKAVGEYISKVLPHLKLHSVEKDELLNDILSKHSDNPQEKDVLIEIVKLIRNWPVFILAYKGLVRNPNLVIKFRNGLKWNVDTTNKGFGIVADLWIGKAYDFLLEGSSLIVDVGAHIGVFSIRASYLNPECQVFAIEASPANFEKLKKNIPNNKNYFKIDKFIQISYQWVENRR